MKENHTRPIPFYEWKQCSFSRRCRSRRSRCPIFRTGKGWARFCVLESKPGGRSSRALPPHWRALLWLPILRGMKRTLWPSMPTVMIVNSAMKARILSLLLILEQGLKATKFFVVYLTKRYLALMKRGSVKRRTEVPDDKNHRCHRTQKKYVSSQKKYV